MTQIFTLFCAAFLLGLLVLGWYREAFRKAFKIDYSGFIEILNAEDLSVAKCLIALFDLPLVWDEKEKSFVTPWEDQ